MFTIEGHPSAPRFTATIHDQNATAAKAARILKALEYLGPWCGNCGRKGPDCTGRQLNACHRRRLAHLARNLTRPELFARPKDFQQREYEQATAQNTP